MTQFRNGAYDTKKRITATAAENHTQETEAILVEVMLQSAQERDLAIVRCGFHSLSTMTSCH